MKSKTEKGSSGSSNSKVASFEKFTKSKTFSQLGVEDKFSWDSIIVMDFIDLNNSQLRAATEGFLSTLPQIPEIAAYLDQKKLDKMQALFEQRKFNNIYQIFDTILAHLFPLHQLKLNDTLECLLYIPKQVIKSEARF